MSTVILSDYDLWKTTPPEAPDEQERCCECKRPFTVQNVHTPEGWSETRISGVCEDCFDEITAEPEDDEGDGDAPAF